MRPRSAPPFVPRHGLPEWGKPEARGEFFVDSKELPQGIRRTIAESVEACGGHLAVATYLAGDEIPADIVLQYWANKSSAPARTGCCV